MINSALWYNGCTVFYVCAMFGYIINLATLRHTVQKMATIVVALGFIAHTIGMLFRWSEAGMVEVTAFERTTGTALQGLARFIVYTQHPPWSNLYEIMVFMGWGIIFVFLIIEVKWRVKLLGIFALFLALSAIGLASLQDSMVKPLVPALKSWWIMIHVISASSAYACGTLAAVVSLMYLVKAKDRISINKLASYTMGLSGLLGLLLGRGVYLFTDFSYRVKLLREMNGDFIVVQKVVGDNMTPAFVISPGVGPLLCVSVILCFVAALSCSGLTRGFGLTLQKMGPGVKPEDNKIAKFLYWIATLCTILTIGLIIFNNLYYTRYVPISDGSLLMPPAPWRIGFASNSWDLGLFAIIVGAQLFMGLVLSFPEKVRGFLPGHEKLDQLAYSTVIVAFFLMAVVLMTGALWAHYAWGRYWAWDPKETGALMIFITYAIYLHTRITHGFAGVPSAVICIIGFFVILAGFLGVNLGFFADGLHSYGST